MSEVYSASFIGGEVSPEISARADLAKYSIFCDKCRNMIVQQQGGVKRRTGTKFLSACHTQDSVKKLIPFNISAEEYYALEFGIGYMSAYTPNGLVCTITTPYTAENIKNLNYTQVKDSIILCDGIVIKEVQRIISNSAVSFVMKDYITKYNPFSNDDEEDIVRGYITQEDNNLYLNSFTDTFLSSDINRQYRLKIYIDGNKITHNSNDMQSLKSRQILCYSSWALRVKTGWTGEIRFEYSKDGNVWYTHKMLATSNNNTEWAITGDFSTEEQPVLVRFNGVNGGVNGNVMLDFETLGFWYYLILDVKKFVDSKKVRVNLVDMPNSNYKYLPAAEYTQAWNFPNFETSETITQEISKDNCIVRSSFYGNLSKVRDENPNTYCELPVYKSPPAKRTMLTFIPNTFIKGGIVKYSFKASFDYNGSLEDLKNDYATGSSGNVFLSIDFMTKMESGTSLNMGPVEGLASECMLGEDGRFYWEKTGELSLTDVLPFSELTVIFVLRSNNVKPISNMYMQVYSIDINSYQRKNWELGRPAWTAERGIPKAVTQFQQRLVFASTKSEPDTIWATETGEKYSFFKNVSPKSADSITTAISDNKNTRIVALNALKSLLVFCSGGEFVLSSEVFTPLNTGFTKQSEFGFLNNSAFETVGNKIIFPQNMGTVLREYIYDYASDGYAGRDISIFVRHLFQGRKIKEIVYQQEPNSVLWVLLDSGELLNCTYLPEQEILAWGKCEFAGKVLTICGLYGNGQNDLYLIIERDINGAKRQFVEMLTHEAFDLENMCYLDSAYIYNSEDMAITTFTCAHLGGLGVIDVMADGVYLTNVPISAEGIVDISEAMPNGVKHIIAGIKYESQLRTLPINTDGNNVLLNKKIRFPWIDINIHNSVSCLVGFKDKLKEKILPVYEEYDKLPVLQSGWKHVQLNADNERGACVDIRLREPYPLNILGLIINAV